MPCSAPEPSRLSPQYTVCLPARTLTGMPPMSPLANTKASSSSADGPLAKRAVSGDNAPAVGTLLTSVLDVALLWFELLKPV